MVVGDDDIHAKLLGVFNLAVAVYAAVHRYHQSIILCQNLNRDAVQAIALRVAGGDIVARVCADRIKIALSTETAVTPSNVVVAVDHHALSRRNRAANPAYGRFHAA
jgi:hypothetical protein